MSKIILLLSILNGYISEQNGTHVRQYGFHEFLKCFKSPELCGLKPPDYKPPIIHNCPHKDHRVVVKVSKYKNIAFLNSLRLTATDWGGDPLHVTLSKDEFQHCKCLSAHETVVAEAIDKYHGVATCIFSVAIEDEYSPVVQQCPSDQHVRYGERVFWSEPNITDNVGIRYIRKPVYQNNTIFRPGLYNIEYEAHDWSRNTAMCSFRISVQSGVKDKHSPPKDSSFVISGTLVGVLFIALIVLSAAMIRLYRKRIRLSQRRTRQSRSSRPLQRTDDTIFTVYNSDPPPYDIVFTEKLPEYTPRDDPPSYEDVQTCSDSNGENIDNLHSSETNEDVFIDNRTDTLSVPESHTNNSIPRLPRNSRRISIYTVETDV